MKKNQTLLEMAKSHGTRKVNKKVFNEQELELAIAWANGEINLNQILEVVPHYKSQTQIYVFISNCFRNLVLNNKIKFN
jgi:hypothetical protein